MAKVAQKKALQELAMQLPDHDGWIHYTETLFALAYRNQSEQAVEDLPEDIPRVDEIQTQKEARVKEDGERGVLDPKPLQQTMAVLSFQAQPVDYCSRQPRAAKSSQPRAARSSPKQPRAAQTAQSSAEQPREAPRAARSSYRQPGAAKHPGSDRIFCSAP